MRKVKYFVANSLDNYIARKNGCIQFTYRIKDQAPRQK